MMVARLMYAVSTEVSERVKKAPSGLAFIKSTCFWSSVDMRRRVSRKEVRWSGCVESKVINVISFSASKFPRLRLLCIKLVD